MRLLLISVFLIFFSLSNCNNGNPVKPKNNSPQILSLEVFPKTIGPTDSVIVICNAIEPDGDTLFYDWITDGRLRIKGVLLPGDDWIYNSLENTRVFYPKAGVVKTPIDTPWVQCFVRDGKGGADAETILFYVKSD